MIEIVLVSTFISCIGLFLLAVIIEKAYTYNRHKTKKVIFKKVEKERYIKPIEQIKEQEIKKVEFNFDDFVDFSVPDKTEKIDNIDMFNLGEFK